MQGGHWGVPGLAWLLLGWVAAAVGVGGLWEERESTGSSSGPCWTPPPAGAVSSRKWALGAPLSSCCCSAACSCGCWNAEECAAAGQGEGSRGGQTERGGQPPAPRPHRQPLGGGRAALAAKRPCPPAPARQPVGPHRPHSTHHPAKGSAEGALAAAADKSQPPPFTHTPAGLMAAPLAAAQPERSLAAPACGGPHRPAASAAARQAPQADTRAAAVPGGSAGGAACVPCTWKREGVGKAAHQKAGAAACLAAMRSKGAAGLGQEAAWGCCAWAVAQPKQQQAGAGSREGGESRWGERLWVFGGGVGAAGWRSLPGAAAPFLSLEAGEGEGSTEGGGAEGTQKGGQKEARQHRKRREWQEMQQAASLGPLLGWSRAPAAACPSLPRHPHPSSTLTPPAQCCCCVCMLWSVPVRGGVE